MRVKNMSDALCPECGKVIVLGANPRIGQWVSCPHCDSDLEIVSVRPLELDYSRFLDDELTEEDLADELPADELGQVAAADWGEEDEWVEDEGWPEDEGPDESAER
jgi:lysine biosynthesis protein LysW